MNPYLDAALDAHLRGYTPIRVQRASNRPEGKRWQKTAYADADDVAARFEGAAGIGLRLGDGLADVDLDCEAAREAAALLLPHTAMRSGRPGSPASHWWYTVDDDCFLQHRLTTKSMLVELRANAEHQTVIPPSVHKSKERRTWTGEPFGGVDGPRKVRTADLRVAVAGVAIVAALRDRWPTAEGSRNDACLSLAGWMLRDGGHEEPALVDLAGRVVEALALLTGDDEAHDRVPQTVDQTAQAYAGGRADVKGWTALRDLLDGDPPVDVRDACARALNDARDALGLPAVSAGSAAQVGTANGWQRLEDGPLGEAVAARLADTYCWSAALGWTRYDGRRWARVTDVEFTEQTRLTLKGVRVDEEVKANGDLGRIKALVALLSRGKVGAVASVAKGILECQGVEFDNQPDLLNVGNGVVDLRTGDLLPHDPAYRFTQITEVAYVPGARHDDWDKALRALPDDVLPWWQRKMGQAITGHAAADDVVPICFGGGENGKTTVLLALKRALGDFCVPVPEKLLLAKANDHSTEIMTLKGARVALLEELPETDYLDMHRIKRVTGQEAGLTARYIGQDNVTWQPTHTLIVSTNHDLQVTEVDHGTWRRLARVVFPFTFDGSDPDRPRDARLRDRLRDGKSGQHEAVLAWLVEGAVAFYRNGLTRDDQPDRVRAATDEWRKRGNLAVQFLDAVLEPAEGCAVRGPDLFRMFTAWARDSGRRPLADQTFWGRAAGHDLFQRDDVERVRTDARKWRVYGHRTPEERRLERLVTGVALTPEGEDLWRRAMGWSPDWP